jgi:hypothetical protein
MQKTINFNSTNTLDLISNLTSNKTIVILSYIMKLKNSTNSYESVSMEYADSTPTYLTGSAVSNDNVFTISDTGSQGLDKDGQNVIIKASSGLSGDLTMIINYELV